MQLTVVPPLSEAATRLARWLAAEDFQSVRVAITKRAVRDLNGPRRLRPGDHALIMSNGGFGGLHGKLLAALAGAGPREAGAGAGDGDGDGDGKVRR